MQELAPQIRIMVADDHDVVREGLAAMIGRQPDLCVVGAATDGNEAVLLWRQCRPDIALLDLRMAGKDGLEAMREIRAEDANARCIVLTTFATDHDVLGAVRAGAKGYLQKDATREELLGTIRRVHEGQTCLPASVVSQLASVISSEALTGRERDVLIMLAKGRTNREIGANLYISETTVKSHLRSIFSKLNVLSRTEAVTVATRRGLIQH